MKDRHMRKKSAAKSSRKRKPQAAANAPFDPAALPDESYVNEHDAARITGIPAKLLRQWRWQRVGPPFFKVSHRLVRYKTQDLRRFMGQHRRQP
jgi:hypothetical protein